MNFFSIKTNQNKTCIILFKQFQNPLLQPSVTEVVVGRVNGLFIAVGGNSAEIVVERLVLEPAQLVIESRSPFSSTSIDFQEQSR